MGAALLALPCLALLVAGPACLALLVAGLASLPFASPAVPLSLLPNLSPRRGLLQTGLASGPCLALHCGLLGGVRSSRRHFHGHFRLPGRTPNEFLEFFGPHLAIRMQLPS